MILLRLVGSNLSDNFEGKFIWMVSIMEERNKVETRRFEKSNEGY